MSERNRWQEMLGELPDDDVLRAIIYQHTDDCFKIALALFTKGYDQKLNADQVTALAKDAFFAASLFQQHRQVFEDEYVKYVKAVGHG